MISSRFIASLAVSVSFLGLPAVGHAALIEFEAALSSEVEVPTPTIPAGFDPSGSLSGLLDTDSNQLWFDLNWTGLTTPAVAAHFHNGTPTGPVLIGFPDFPPLQSGVYTGFFALSDEEESAFLSGLDAGTLYVNVHTQLNPPGEIRGFLAPVPEPETYALFATGLIGAAVAARRRNRR